MSTPCSTCPSTAPSCPRATRHLGAQCPATAPCRSPSTSSPDRGWRRASDAGVAHFMEHVTFKGTRDYPTTRAVSEAIEGYGGQQRGHRSRDHRLLGTGTRPRGGARLQRVVGADRSTSPARRRHRARARHHRRGDSFVSQTIPASSSSTSSIARFRRHPARLGDRRRRGVGAGLTEDDVRSFWSSMYAPAIR